jgi:hypothetical protein
MKVMYVKNLCPIKLSCYAGHRFMYCNETQLINFIFTYITVKYIVGTEKLEFRFFLYKQRPNHLLLVPDNCSRGRVVILSLAGRGGAVLSAYVSAGTTSFKCSVSPPTDS